MPTRDFNELAAKLERQPTALAAFQSLSQEQVGLLDGLIEAARTRYRRELEAELGRVFGSRLGRLMLAQRRRGTS